MYKILHVYPQLMCGGTETVFYNLIKFSTNTNFHYDILVQKDGEMEEKFFMLGCNIIKIPFLDTIQYHKDLASLFVINKYQAIHCHMHEDMFIVLEEAYKAGIPHRISHSHNARIDIPKFLWPIRYFKHHKYEKFTTDFFGCSDIALKWLFPSMWKRGIVIYNGIDLEAFRFNSTIRKQYRAKLKVKENTKIVINIGRCTEQKNQKFILDCANELKDKDFLFIIIGEGPLLKPLQQRIIDEKINNVKFLGKQFDVPNWLCAADIFMFPSLYEGLGIVAIEAQANGLPVLSTDSIPHETDMNIGIFHRISLNDVKQWKAMLIESCNSEDIRNQKSIQAYSSNYNIKNVIKKVENIYIK